MEPLSAPSCGSLTVPVKVTLTPWFTTVLVAGAVMLIDGGRDGKLR